MKKPTDTVLLHFKFPTDTISPRLYGICSTFAHHHHHSPWPPSAAFPQALGSQPDDKNVSTTNSLALYTFQRKFQIFSDHLFGLLEYVDKLCGIFAVLLGEEGVGGASVAFSPGSADPADFFWR